MASVPVTIIGVMTYSDLAVGGGPMPGGPTPMPPIYYPPSGGGGGQPPGIWPSPGYPAHPISPGGPPPGIWPSPGHPAHPISPGGPPPGIWPSPGHPAHPISPGGQPDQPPGGEGSNGGRWAWSPQFGWVWLPSGSGDKPHPPDVPGDEPHVEPHA